MARIFSGIQPSGELHIGNYLGAVKNWVALQGEHPGAIFCIVNYHAITGAYEPASLRERTHDMAVSLLAAGIVPAKATLYVQSNGQPRGVDARPSDAIALALRVGAPLAVDEAVLAEAGASVEELTAKLAREGECRGGR